MCNLYTYKLSRDEIRGLMQHYKLIGTEWAELFDNEMAGKNDEALVYPKYQAPVEIVQDSEREFAHLGWGMPAPVPPLTPGEKPKRPGFLTNVRNTRSGHWRNCLAAPAVTVGKDKLQGGRLHRAGHNVRQAGPQHQQAGGQSLVRARRWAAVLLRRHLARVAGRPRVLVYCR